MLGEQWPKWSPGDYPGVGVCSHTLNASAVSRVSRAKPQVSSELAPSFMHFDLSEARKATSFSSTGL
jgi:hypothetical protein